MASLAEIRARLAASESKQGGNSTGGDNSIYAHWNMEEGQSATLRFLPDGNAKNTFFWQERAMIRLPFNGVKGEMDSKQVYVQVPCMEMWQETCPVLTEVRTWFKDKALEDMGRKYWKKRSYIFQGFVRENPLSDDKTPENPIRRFIIGPQIFTIIKGALMDPELEELPTDLLRGLDFRVTKTSKGGYADYNGSKWARKESALTEAEQAAVETVWTCLIFQHSCPRSQAMSKSKLSKKCLKHQWMVKAMTQNVGGSTSVQPELMLQLVPVAVLHMWTKILRHLRPDQHLRRLARLTTMMTHRSSVCSS
jgi:hypothetical protein